jgi:site-specific recombinase XerC
MRVDERKAMFVFWSLKEVEYNLARRRHAQQGRIEERDGSYWLRYYRDEFREGKLHRARPRQFLGHIAGPQKITKTEAKQKARDFLAEVDRPSVRATAMMTLSDYYFGPYQTHLKATSKNHQHGFRSGMRTHILPALGHLQLREVGRTEVQELINSLVDRGLSASVTHIRAYVAALLNHAIEEKIISGSAVTAHLRMPRKKKRNPKPSLSFEQAQFVLSRLPQPYLTMVAFSLCTSTGIAEMTGLKRRRLNLTRETRMVDDKLLPPYSAWIAENWSKQEFRDTKNVHRERIIPIPQVLVPLFEEVLDRRHFTGPEDAVFASSTGKPVVGNNTNKRTFAPLRSALGIDFTWNSFRHTFASRSEDLRIRQFDKKALMGHSLTADITDSYTDEGWQRMQEITDALAGKFGIESLVNERKEKGTCLKVVSIR